MARVVLAVAVLALYIYAMLDLVRAPSADVRLLPKWLWAVVVLLVFLAGPLLYLVLGRPRVEYPPGGGDGGGSARRGPGPRGPVAPDDDPEFLRRIDEQSWSARMERLRRERNGGGTPPAAGEGPPASDPVDHSEG
ncbi:MAG: PLD nuclease N-terminal domain-containing protein [Candidatus Nanopelagicales bacterium]|nr:PLD nuclease N-terminal domain-containing protein [Candidatus Nanopelagicales bacterium]